MGKRFRNFLKKKSKEREKKKPNPKVGEIEVLLETGTSDPQILSVPTTSSHADSQTITPKLLDLQAGPSGQEALSGKVTPDKPELQDEVSTLLERSLELTNEMDKMIDQLIATEAPMEEEDQCLYRRTLHPLGETKTVPPVKEKKIQSPPDQRTGFDKNLPTSSDKNNGQSCRRTVPSKKQDNQYQTCNEKQSDLLKRNIKLKSLGARCLSVFKRSSTLTKSQRALLIFNPHPVTPPHIPKTNIRRMGGLLDLYLKRPVQQNVTAERLEERNKSTSLWRRYLFSENASASRLNKSELHDNDSYSCSVQSSHTVSDIDTGLDQSKRRSYDGESDEEIFVTPMSSLTSFHTALSATSAESSLNVSSITLEQVSSVSPDRSVGNTTFNDVPAIPSMEVKRPRERLI